jgi:beta-glucosidase
VRVTIKNTGDMDSDEVPQVYLSAPDGPLDGLQFPALALAVFDRVHILKGESQTVTLHVAPRQLQYWSTKESIWVLVAGQRTVSVGSSARDLLHFQKISE